MLLGSFAGSNFGDSIVLHAIAAMSHEAEGGVTLVVPTARPDAVASIPGVEAIDISMRRVRTYRFLGPAVARALRGCNAVVTTAGILFDRHLWDPRRNFISSAIPLLWWARTSERLVYGLNVGVTESTTYVGRLALTSALRAHHTIATRDADSALVAGACAPNIHVEVRADMAHALLSNQLSSRSDDGPIGISLCAYLSSFDPRTRMQSVLQDTEGFLQDMVRLVEAIRKRTGREVRYVATSDQDHLLHLQIAERTGGDAVSLTTLSLEDALGTLSSLSLLIASRLHACICGTSLGVPTLALAYERKVASYMQSIGAERWMHSFAAVGNVDMLVNDICNLLEQRASVSWELRAATQIRGSLARATLCELLERASKVRV